MPASTPAAPVGLTLSQLTRPSELPPRGAPCSPSDLGGGTLQRQGHTQENDVLIDFLRNELAKWQSMEAALAVLQELVEEFMSCPSRNRLREHCPNINVMHTTLHLVDAWRWYDGVFRLSVRRHVKPCFADLRHILNVAQLSACAPTLHMVTTDGDGTIYRHNQCIESMEMVLMIVEMLRAGLIFGLVTAAGYPGQAARYEARLEKLLQVVHAELQAGTLPAEVLQRLFVVGGECNYLLRPVRDLANHRLALQFQQGGWKTEEMAGWSDAAISQLLDRATVALHTVTERLNIDAQFFRKERAVGMVPREGCHPTTEDLDEVVLSLHEELRDSTVPFCAFNSRVDVWLDIGSKAHGIRAMQKHYGLNAAQALHMGDELYGTGNDRTAREAACTVWVEDETETPFYLRLLAKLRQISPPTLPASSC